MELINLNFSIMLKNILNLNGVQKLSKKAQKSISGGDSDCNHNPNVPLGYGRCRTGSTQYGPCYIVIPCGETCPNGTVPVGC
tara:strand:- start:5026 stop:5271 length:246 start_codon:yes stop_codon:yes gene_type:complete